MALLYMRAYIVASSAGPNVTLMDRVEQPIKSDCHDISLRSWEGQLLAHILVEPFRDEQIMDRLA
ncbi:hypothetical protein L195_g021235 [Trifolium pratense]|uniref:Uncharacterized protein n=1 Tax=Trifolium pratense TaxID=57577 RepID=A0A2K3N4K6_TRIPR|nr:hypothetical protein L195_g021235 [Trifolium pratense]